MKKAVKDVVETSVAAKYDVAVVGTMVGGYCTLQAPRRVYPPRPPTLP